MIVMRITDLSTNEVYVVCECGCMYQGETCPQCEPEAEKAHGVDSPDEELSGNNDPPWGIPVPEQELTRELLSWEAYYRRY